MHLATSSCNPTWQEHRSITVPCQCVLSQQVANSHGSSVASHRSTFSQRQECDSTTQMRRCSDPLGFSQFLFRALATVWCAFCRPHLPKVPRACGSCSEMQILDQKIGNPGSHITRKKTHGVRPRECFHLWIHVMMTWSLTVVIGCHWFREKFTVNHHISW